MAKKRKFEIKDIEIVGTHVKVKVDMSRFEKQFQDAQYYLDSQIMTDMLPYMPRQTGTFINLTRARSAALAGSGMVVAAAPPQGRYLYEGKVMVDSVTGKGPRKIPAGPGECVLRYRKGAKLIPTNRPLTYSNPQATPHWFDTAKKNHGEQWVEETKKIAGGN